MGRLSGKTCFVTGAGQGIGRAITETFILEGADVVAADLHFDAKKPNGAKSVLLDVTDEKAVKAAAASFQNVEVLVNCVGYVATGSILDCSMAEFDRSIAVNVRSMALTCRAFLPWMIERSSGSIINIASVVSSVRAVPQRFAYGTSKAAVIGLTKAIASDFVAHGIRCNAISPGTVDSPSLHERWAATGDIEAARSAFIARQPTGRLGQPEEIAAVAALLASDQATFITGSNIVADGGMSL
jgi:2-keto-3-deoxy-L-fuconate dehydrogenase